MKKLNFVFTGMFCLCSFHIKGQDNNESYLLYKNEINLVIDDILAKVAFLETYYDIFQWYNLYPTYNLIELKTPKIGLGYKHYLKQSASRSKISFGYSSQNFDYTQNLNTSRESMFSAEFSQGYEIHKDMKKSQIFYGLDGFLNYGSYYQKYSYVDENQTYYTETKNKITSFGIRPLIGIKYFIIPSLSFSTEIHFNVESFHGSKIYEYSRNNQKTESKVSGINTGFGPTGQLAVNIHF